ncbi:MAG: ATP-binding protein [Vicinamibacterales bacterium]
MTISWSLTNRLFIAMALLAVMSIGAATYYATAAVTAQAEGELRRGVDEAGKLVEEYRTLLLEHFNREARLVADLPRFKATVALNDPPTLLPIARDYAQQLGADLLVITNTQGAELARIASGAGKGILQVVSVPILIDPRQPELLGTLSVGFSLDGRAAARFRAFTNSEIAFATADGVRASTLPESAWPSLAPVLGSERLTDSVVIDGIDYIARTKQLAPSPHSAQPAPHEPPAFALILRSRSERLQFLSRVHRTVLLVAAAAVLVSTLVSYGIARTVTRPLGAVTAAMREMAATGDLTRRIPVSPGTQWEDEDARLLATTFNTMTGSISRFQREAAQRERLSSLGRLSTVIAHEVRNPLMIIKTSLHGLRRADVTKDQVADAVKDIDEEVTRLNRIVSEVLDFARPIRFDKSAVDINALCADAAKAAWPENAGYVRLELAADLPPILSDGERLRIALVNILTNARHAVSASADATPGAVRVVTKQGADRHMIITVQDRGAGIVADDLARIFDPFFTTRRTGTGLGLAITRNIIEGLGGTIAVSSTPAHGTDVVIDLPASAPV